MLINLATQIKGSIQVIADQASDYELPDADEHMGWILTQDTGNISFSISQPPTQGQHFRFVTMASGSNATSCEVEGTILHPGETGVFIYYSSNWYPFTLPKLESWVGYYSSLSGATDICLEYKALTNKKINRFRAETSSGTVDATIEIGGVDTVSVDDESVSSTPVDISFPSNDGFISQGDTVLLQFTNLSSPADLYYQIDYLERI